MIRWGSGVQRFTLRLLAMLALVCIASAGRAADTDTGRSLGTASEAKACLNCHDEPHVTSILHTAHTVKGDPRTGIAEQGCQNCHGNSDAHLIKPADGQLRASPAVVFSGPRASPVAARNGQCLGCHQDSEHMHW